MSTPLPTSPVTRTKAERALSDGFAAALAHLPGAGWVERVRRDAIGAFEASGLPTRRVEAFKYTDLRERLKEAWPAATTARASSPVDSAAIDKALGPLALGDALRIVLVDGVLRPELSHLDRLGAAVEAMPLLPLLRKAPGWLEGKFTAGRLGADDAVISLNTAYMSDGLLIKVKPGHAAARPVLLVSARSAAEPVSITTRNIVAMEPGAGLTLIEVDIVLPGAARQGLTNVLTDVTVADGASLSHIKALLAGAEATHLSSWVVRMGTGSSYRAFQLTADIALARHSVSVRLEGTGSRLDLSGAFLGRATSHIDTTLVVDHAAPGCQSRELFKGVLDERARGVFQGKIIVRPGADQTDGKQMARALMLSEEAEFDAKPELEIFADDVACGHGATSAALDSDLMFYCKSRGIPEAEARALLIESFVGEAVDKVEDEAVRSALMEIARGWLQNLR